MTACLLQEGVKDHGHLFLKLARLVSNHHALPTSKSVLRIWGWTAKILKSNCTTSPKRGGPRDCFPWQHWAPSPITSSLLLLPVHPGVRFLGWILSSTAYLTTFYCNRAVYQLEVITQSPVQSAEATQATPGSLHHLLSLFPFIF